MSNHNMTPFQSDRATGRVGAPSRLAVIDGIPGWVVATDIETGQVWAYAPVWYMNLYGEIAREI